MLFPTSYLELAVAHARNSRVKKEKNKTNKKNVLPVRPVAAALALNHVEVLWLLAVMAEPIFEQFSTITRESKMII